MNYDFLVKFDVKDNASREVELQYVGWYEPEATFQRVGKVESKPE